MIRFAQSIPEEWDSFGCFTGFAATSDNVESWLKGLIDVYVEQVAVTTTKITVKVLETMTKYDLYDSYSTTLASVPLWSLTKAGASVTITGVAKNDALKAWELSLSAGTGAHVVNLAGTATLNAAGVGGPPDCGFESTSLTVTLP